MSWKNQICSLNLSAAFEPAPAGAPVHKRLTEEFARLEKLERQRAKFQDPLLRKLEEERIIWRELRELEWQELNEPLNKISAAWTQFLSLHRQET